MMHDPTINEVLYKVDNYLHQHSDPMPKWITQLITNRAVYLSGVLIRGGNIKEEISIVMQQLFVAALISKDEGWIDTQQ